MKPLYPFRWIDHIPEWYWNKLDDEERKVLLETQTVIENEK